MTDISTSLRLAELSTRITGLENAVNLLIEYAKSKADNFPSHITLEKAMYLKFGENANMDSITKNYKFWQYPCCNTAFHYVNGHKCWTPEQILEWLDITDETIEFYARKMGVNIEKYFRNGHSVCNIQRSVK